MKENIIQSIPATVPTIVHKRSGVSLNRALRIQSYLEGRLHDIYSHARHFLISHDAVLELYGKMRETSQFKKAPRWVHSYIHGYGTALARSHYSVLEWRLSYKGQLLSKAECEAAKVGDKDFYSHVDGDAGRHTYIGRPDKVY